MASINGFGYLNVSTNKYGYTGVIQYGSGWEYGLNYPPPTPTDLTVENAPSIVDQTPRFSWTNPTFGWAIPYGDLDPITYQLQIVFGVNNFTTPTSNVSGFSANQQTYELASEFELQVEGTYYARIRSTDGFTWSDWSETLTFVLYMFAPNPPTIDTVTTPADDFWQVITGTKSTALYVFIRNNGGSWKQASYTNGLSGYVWQYNMPLVAGTNLIEVISAVTTSTLGAISKPAQATIYLAVLTPEIFNVWNCFDEFGLLLGLSRILGEKNADYKDRLLDVYANPANSTYAGLRYGIARELGLTYSNIGIDKLSDLADSDYSGNLLTSEGTAIGTKLEDYAEEVYAHNPIFFGTIISDESYWDGIDEEESTGYSYLPHLWDPRASGIYGKWMHGGIGDNDDLWIAEPKEIWVPGISGYAWYLHVHSGYFYSVYPSGILAI